MTRYSEKDGFSVTVKSFKRESNMTMRNYNMERDVRLDSAATDDLSIFLNNGMTNKQGLPPLEVQRLR